MNLYDKKQKRKGYTLAEILAAVAILLILMAIAVPAIFSIRKNLHQKALDSKAELIYTAVQNNLVKMQSNGNSSMYAKDKATPMGVIPSDATEEKTLYYVTSASKENENSAASVLMTVDTVDEDLYNHYWVVEYNPESASVYAVFYSETRSDYNPETYNNLRYKEERLSDGARVGYYGGDAIESSNTSTLAPKISITNEEKLVASITCMRQDSKDLSFEITLTDGDNNSITLKYKPSVDKKKLVHDQDDLHSAARSDVDKNESSSIVGKKYTLNITLDDLTKDSLRFAALYGNKNSDLTKVGKTPLNAGTSLKIKATVRSASSRVDGKYSEAVTNSLFADSSSDTQASIIYGRHLQNLDQGSGVSANITEAVQQSNIHFEEQKDKEDGDTSSWYSCYKEKTFTPIFNSNLKSYKGNSNAAIYHLTVDKAVAGPSSLGSSSAGTYDAGLFAFLNDGMTVDAVALSGASVKITNKSNAYVGALAGQTLGGATITNCQVFLESEDLEGKSDSDSWISGGLKMGGLIGQTGGKVTITNSFASTVMDGGETGTVGGLVGEDGGGIQITSSYSDSYLTGNVTGGLIANARSSVTINSSYTAGYQKAKSNAGGMVAKATDTEANLKDVYSAVTFVDFTGTDTEGTVTQAVRYSIAPGTVTNGYYLNKGNVREDQNNHDQGTNVSYKELSDRATMTAKLGGDFVASTTTHAYNLRNQGLSSYSYPALKNMSHYGDWEASYEPGSLVYYEKYGDNTIREVGFFGGNITSTLLDNQTILGDGYGVVYLDRDAPQTPVLLECQTGADENTTTTITINPTDTHYKVQVENNTYLVYPLSTEIINASAITGTFYQKLTIKGENAVGGTDGTSTQNDDVINGRTFYFNPHFAKTVEITDEVPADPTRIAIRTARQLYHLSLYYNDYADITKNSIFNQETDIDYTTYDWQSFAGTQAVTVQSPLGVRDRNLVAFASTYNGGSHEIRGISFETSATSVGFIGENAGIVQNVLLVSDWKTGTGVSNLYVNYSGTIGSNRTVYAGVLAGVNKGRIQNCAVCGYQIGKSGLIYVQRNGTLYAGGLVGNNQGSILNCEADVPSISTNVLYGNAYLGGFAGENAASGTIRNSYALGNVSVTFARGANAVIGGFTASNTGVLRSDYCAVAMTAAGSTSTYGFAPKGNGIISSDCYYLNGGTFLYLGKMLAFDNDNENGGGTGLFYTDMVKKTGSKAVFSRDHSATNEDDYPFGAVVSNTAGRIHYGNWQIPVDLGGMGVIYWELEEGGANNGYHFSYIGYTQDAESPADTLHMVSGSTLCEQHDDSGKIRMYGYGYYYANTLSGTKQPVMQTPTDFQTGDVNNEASAELTARLDGFTVVAYTTEPSIDGNSGLENYMKMTRKDRQANGQWSFTYNGQTYTFTINPFFANAMQYGADTGTTRVNAIASQSLTVLDENGVEVQADASYPMPGTAENEYEVRSDDQLQYLNWNYKTKNAYTMIGEDNYRDQVNAYPYLGYASEFYQWTGNNSPSRQRYYQNWFGSNYYSENTSYWEFYENENGKEYSVTVWTYLGADWYGNKYSVSYEQKKGYWRWVGDETPTSGTGTQGGNNYEYINDSQNVNCRWKQTHDVDAEMEHTSESKFTQIGSMYDELGKYDKEAAAAYMTYFCGHYDGNTYYIKNVEIDSKNTVVGLFGSIIGADVQNIILYSENENYIQRNEASPRSWYAIGGMCGLAAVGQGKEPSEVKIRNCTVSGYVIRDNSTWSSWGDGNVGGMFGMCTVDLTRCTAVNTIDLNTKFDARKSDGVSVRTGGLVGSMRGNITSCYTGGKIKCEERCITDAELAVGGTTSTKLFLGGITGGIYIKNAGTLTKLLGGPIQGLTNWDTKHTDDRCTTPTTTISNSYTYIEMPTDSRAVKAVKSIEPIGSNAETPFENDYNHHVRVLINNCYYYENNIPSTSLKQFTVANGRGNNKQNWTNIGSGWAKDIWGNYWESSTGSMAISWDQLAGNAPIEKNGTSKTLLEWLNTDNTTPFETVTTTENGQKVNGKYSFPGDRTDLDGEDYPFPTVLQQGSGNGHVNVHYGEWPLEGIYWKESRASMDIYEDLVLEEGDNYGIALKDFELLDSKNVLGTGKTLGTGSNDLQVEYGSGEDESDIAAFASGSTESTEAVFTDGTDSEAEEFSSDMEISDGTSDAAAVGATGTDTTADTADSSRILDSKDYIAEVVAINYDSTKKCYVATVKARKTGTTVITVKTTGIDGKPYRASFTLTVTADLTVYASPTSITQNAGASTDVTLYAVPTAMMTSANALDFAGANVIVGADGFAGEYNGDAGSSGFESTAEIADVTIDSNSTAETYAGDSQDPEKNLASFITWEVKASEEGPVSISSVVNSRFKVTSEAEVPVTLTITGKFTYEGVEYTSITWIEVTSTEIKEIKWKNESEELVLTASATETGVTPTEKTFYLNVPEGCLKDNEPVAANFTIFRNSGTVQQTYTDDSMERSDTDGMPVITKIEKTSATIYGVTIKGFQSGYFTITFNAVGADGTTNYTDSFQLAIKEQSISEQNPSDISETDPVNPGWTETPEEDSDFTSDDATGWGEQNNDYVDIVPDDDGEGFTGDSGNWEGNE